MHLNQVHTMQACRVAADLASSNAVSARKVAAYDPEDATKLASTASWKAYEVNQTGPCFSLTSRYRGRENMLADYHSWKPFNVFEMSFVGT
jgi:hypothetical protein